MLCKVILQRDMATAQFKRLKQHSCLAIFIEICSMKVTMHMYSMVKHISG